MTEKSVRFLIGDPEILGRRRRLMTYNPKYEGGVSVQNLIDFLKEKGIDPAKVPLYSFATYISEGDVEGDKDGE